VALHDPPTGGVVVTGGVLAGGVLTGGVDTGDTSAAENQRAAMLDIKAEAMDPLAAAETVFDQAAEGRFYLLTQPEYVGSAMAERGRILTNQEPPQLRTERRFDPAQT